MTFNLSRNFKLKRRSEESFFIFIDTRFCTELIQISADQIRPVGGSKLTHFVTFTTNDESH